MGSQWKEMGRDIINIDIVRRSFEKSAKLVQSHFLIDILKILLDDEDNLISQSTPAHLAILAIQIALVDLLTELKIFPDFYIGHSLGELMCAYADGCLDREQILAVAYWRSQLQDIVKLKPGKMAVVGLSWQECQIQCPPDVWPVCHNSFRMNTIAGELKATEQFTEQLLQQGVMVRDVDSCNMAYHSQLMMPAKKIGIIKLNKYIKQAKLRSKKWISSCAISDNIIWENKSLNFASAEYFMYNLLSPVLFYEAMINLPKDAIVVEVGPHSLLQSIIKVIRFMVFVARAKLMRKENQ